ncbi:Chromosome (plasmid) partitioning protein ParB / Stage 0 sporulation protein J [Fimbriiglobus ruber]|uniref:Chromosome (Plasmid) partitioning protein ParB / Stage 0 sporulation protein J n=1 Tax=Fimbriiglobus ruber TaxID=1908690 RepID=A0A225DL13_9BACT|nr:Chromosome (plasmid) partitioning protein ParB / Stage 0 sporulation protein J [Fimbriiglobus ruber]
MRKTFPAEETLRALARSVMKRQMHPLIILTSDYLIDGECRFRGMMLENPEFEFDVICVDHEVSPAEIKEMQLISAMHSISLTVYEQALACKEWMEQGNGTAKELAEKIDRDQSLITKLLSLWKTIPEVMKAAEEGHIGLKNWYSISLQPECNQLGLLQMYLSKMPVAEIEAKSRKMRKPAATGTQKVTRIKCPVPGKSSTVLVSGAGVTFDEFIETLNDLVKLAKRENEKGTSITTFQKICHDLSKKG